MVEGENFQVNKKKAKDEPMIIIMTLSELRKPPW
jgi:hypothetical protein